MDENNVEVKVLNAAKWSSLSEIAAKIIGPITNMILARLVSPEAFGVVATVTMISSFADIFIDAGFQKYLIQHQFADDDEKFNSANVAFWTNMCLSILMYILIFYFREDIAILVGNPGIGNVIAVACIQLPISSFASMQMALYRRDFYFKTLFIIRICLTIIPFVVTIPLALLGYSYWALVGGLIFSQITNAVILTLKSKWKPKPFFSIQILKKMLSFSIWSFVEGFSIWFTTWVDIFIVGKYFSQYQLGMYKTSLTLVNTLFTIITGSIVPVLFSALSRLQNDDDKFNYMYMNTLRLASVFVFPLGIGIYIYSDLATVIMLGNDWLDASRVVGINGLTISITIIFGYFSSEIYRAKGRPKLSFLAQILHLVILVPTCIISSKSGFNEFIIARSIVRLQFILVHLLIMKYFLGFHIMEIFRKTSSIAISAILMGVVGFALQKMSDNVAWSIISIILCSVFYFGILYIFTDIRNEINKVLSKIKIKCFMK